jgi:hypothetical protein
MSRISFANLLAAACVAALILSWSHQALAWQVIRGSNGKDVQAMLGMTVVDGVNAVLIVDFVAKFECNPVVTLLEYRGRPLGAPITRTAQRSAKKMTISAGRVSASFYPWLIEYANGSELVCNEADCNPVLEAIVLGHYPIRVNNGFGRTLEFPVGKDRTAIREAQQMCVSSLSN